MFGSYNFFDTAKKWIKNMRAAHLYDEFVDYAREHGRFSDTSFEFKHFIPIVSTIFDEFDLRGLHTLILDALKFCFETDDAVPFLLKSKKDKKRVGVWLVNMEQSRLFLRAG